MKKILTCILAAGFIAGCGPKKEAVGEKSRQDSTSRSVKDKLSDYQEFTLTTDLTRLSESDRKMLPHLMDAAMVMDTLFWLQAYGLPDTFLNRIKDDSERRFAQIQYGPWDRLDDNKPFMAGVGNKPDGARFYPTDMTKEEFEKWDDKNKSSLYSIIQRDSAGKLQSVPYHVYYKAWLERASAHVVKAAELAQDKGLKNYLFARAKSLLTDEYYTSDMLWMSMKTNQIDFVIGPIETYEDHIFGYKASYEAYVLVKDMEWSKKLEKFAAFLPELQQGLPVDPKFKAEKAGTDADLNAYDVVYYAGDCNSGSKTIAINLPNDEKVQLKKGTRRLQLKNTMDAKFKAILEPIAGVLIDSSQRKHITFDAFFSTVMFHEVAHGLGIKYVADKSKLSAEEFPIIKKDPKAQIAVRDALKDHASALEEGKADILGLYMITQLHRKGELEGDLKDYYTTFLAGIFRSVRFGAASAHGKANMIRFNFFSEKGAFERTTNATYKVNFEKMEQAMNELSALILTLQGTGDYAGTDKLVKEKGVIKPELQADLDKLRAKKIPVDIVFKQGKKELGF